MLNYLSQSTLTLINNFVHFNKFPIYVMLIAGNDVNRFGFFAFIFFQDEKVAEGL